MYLHPVDVGAKQEHTLCVLICSIIPRMCRPQDHLQDVL